MSLKNRGFSILVVVLLLYPTASFAQQEVTGRVTDQCGNPVPLATIQFKNASSSNGKRWTGGTVTGSNGTYRIMLYDPTDSVVVTHINYQDQMVKYDGNATINFIVQTKVDLPYKITIAGKHKYSSSELEKLKSKNVDPKGVKAIFTKVEINAEFPKGYQAFMKYLNESIIYPEEATVSDVKGIVKVGFTVDKAGLVKDIFLIKGINAYADNAVLNAIAKSPKWSPAMQNGRFVEQYREVEVAFDIEGE